MYENNDNKGNCVLDELFVGRSNNYFFQPTNYLFNKLVFGLHSLNTTEFIWQCITNKLVHGFAVRETDFSHSNITEFSPLEFTQ